MELALAVPVAPGKRELLENLARVIMGPRRTEFDASRERLNITAEHWFVQSTPQGDIAISYIEAEDPRKVWQEWLGSTDPFDVWVKGQIAEFSGVSLDRGSLESEWPDEVLRWRGRTPE